MTGEVRSEKAFKFALEKTHSLMVVGDEAEKTFGRTILQAVKIHAQIGSWDSVSFFSRLDTARTHLGIGTRGLLIYNEHMGRDDKDRLESLIRTAAGLTPTVETGFLLSGRDASQVLVRSQLELRNSNQFAENLNTWLEKYGRPLGHLTMPYREVA